MDKFLTFQQTLAALQISKNTLLKLIAEGQIKFKRVGRLYRFDPKWIDAYMRG